MWNIETRFDYGDGTHAVRTFMVYGRSMEQALTRGRLIVRQHIAANRYADAKIVRVYKQEKPTATR
jgi:hypothetical protein